MPGTDIPTTIAGANGNSGIAGITNTQGGSALGGGSNSSGPGAPTSPSTFKMTDGWYVAIACTTGVVLADTRVGPLVFGILGIALIFQLTLLLQHK